MNDLTFVVKVEKPTNRADVPFKVLFEKQLVLSDSIQIPFSSLTSNLMFLYGFDSKVTFSISNL